MTRLHLAPERASELFASASAVLDDDLHKLVDSPHANTLFLAIVNDEEDDAGSWARSIHGPRRWNGRRIAIALAAAAVTIGAVLSTATFHVFSSSRSVVGAQVTVALPSKLGNSLSAVLPNDAVVDGSVNWSDVPAHIAVSSGGAVVGYVSRSDLETAIDAANSSSASTPLQCGADGVNVINAQTQLIGHLYPGAGWVPLGDTPVCTFTSQGSTPTSSLPLNSPGSNCVGEILGGSRIVTGCGTDTGRYSK